MSDEVLLAYDLNGGPLPPQHGYPLRLVVPGWYGMTNVKWLTRITVVTEPFTGYQNARGYRFRQTPDEQGTPVDRMVVRSLMVPPGIPDFATRRRFADRADPDDRGPRVVGRRRHRQGRGQRRRRHDLARRRSSAPTRDPRAWRGWTFEWEPDGPGEYELCCRATDSAGNVQPLDIPWNLGGYANNAVQRVPVVVG